MCVLLGQTATSDDTILAHWQLAQAHSRGVLGALSGRISCELVVKAYSDPACSGPPIVTCTCLAQALFQGPNRRTRIALVGRLYTLWASHAAKYSSEMS